MNTVQKDLYSDIILGIRCGSYQGETIMAKPILFYSVINMIEKRIVLNNRIPYGEETEREYKETFKKFGIRVTPFFKPFYYLQYDGMWHFEWSSKNHETKRPSAKYIRENVQYAYLDNTLWDLLQEQGMRDYFREIIENHYLK